MTSAMLKRYKDEGCPVGDQPLLAWAFHDSVHRTELVLSAALRNYPIRPVGWLLWPLVFPWGRRAQAPRDRPGHRPAASLMAPNEASDRLARGVFTPPFESNPAGGLDRYLATAIHAAPVTRQYPR